MAETFDGDWLALREPFEERPGREHLAEPAPSEVTAAYRTFCGT